MPQRKAARVFPEPVGAQIRAFWPAVIGGQPVACAGVGAWNDASNQRLTGSLKGVSGLDSLVREGMGLNPPILRFVCGGAIALMAAGCGAGGGSSTSSEATGSSAAPEASRPLPRDQDLAAGCPALYRRSLALIRHAQPSALGPLTRKRVRSFNFASCGIGTKRPNGINVRVTLDTAPHVLQGYANRLVESEQFGQQTTKGLSPVPVKGVGDHHVGGGGANWIPAFNQLLSVRGHHMLAVNVYVRGLPRPERERIAEELALLAWDKLGVPRS